MTSQDKNPQRVNTIDTVQLLDWPRVPPNGDLIVCASGTSNTSASNARLVQGGPGITTNLLLDLVADLGDMPVITPVTAARRFNLSGYETVTVRGATNEKTVDVPQRGRRAAAKATGEDFSQKTWRATHFLNNKAKPEPVIPGSQLTAFFSDQVSGTVTGSGGCNRYFASFVWQPIDSINIYDLGHTMLYCEGLMEQEKRFFSCLLQAREIECKGEILELRSGPSGAGVGVRFDLAKPE